MDWFVSNRDPFMKELMRFDFLTWSLLVYPHWLGTHKLKVIVKICRIAENNYG